MADTEKQGAMVLHEEGVAAPTLAPPTTTTTPPSIFVVLKQLQSGDVGKEKTKLMAVSEANTMGKSLAAIRPTPSTFVDTNNTTQSENLPADVRCKGITVTLDNNNMWNEFHKCKTEMILTKPGRRMFPYCRFRLSGMEPFQSYVLAMDIIPVDNNRYKWSGKGWEPNGKAEPHVSRLFVHPESPATGLHWMQYPVSFYRLKLCNALDQEDHIILHSMHRYLPRLHLMPADNVNEGILANRPNVVTLSFAQTEFFAVTAYQNLCITQLKIDYNPFAKGFREDAVNARSCKAKNGVSTEETESELKLSREMTTLNNLKTLFMKRNASVKVNNDVPSATNGEKKVVNAEAPVVDTKVQSLCGKKRPSSLAFSDFIKGAHVKVKRLSLDKMNTNGVVLQTSKTSTNKQNELMDLSETSESTLQVDCINESVESGVLICKSTDTSLNADENKMDTDKNALQASEQNASYSDEKELETLSSVDTEANIKKTLPQKNRPERVPLPLLAQFLKQRKSKTRHTTVKPDSQSSFSDSEKSCEPPLTSESLSSTPNLDTQPVVTSLSKKDTISTTDASNMPSLSDTLIPSETQLSVSTSPVGSPTNTTSPSKPDSDPIADSISSGLCKAGAVSTPDLDNTLRSQSDISSVFTCDAVIDSCPPKHDTDFVVSSPTSVLDMRSSTNNEMIPDPELTSMPEVAESKSISDCLLDNSKDSCPEIFSELPPNTLFTNEDSLSLQLDDPSSPSFSLPSPVPSSPDPFPPSLFCDRPVPPRKTLDSFPERLLGCTGSSAPDLLPLGLFDDRPLPPKQVFDFVSENPTSREPPDGLECLETSDSFSQNLCPDKPDSINDLQSGVSCETTVPLPTKLPSPESCSKKSKPKQKKIGKPKLSEDNEVSNGHVPVPMQPSLEDVEGQLFVSFTSKKALQIHLGDDAKQETAQKNTDSPVGSVNGAVEKNIVEQEKALLRDLKFMKNRQVIHPVLQEVGLKLNLLDLKLEIDLQYLGVQLPIPPSALPPEGTSSQVQYVSRTGKTSDVTQIKGWRDKFVASGPHNEAVASTDGGQNNLSAFCSDMLDEYLASEGKLIDERAAALSQTDTTLVAYELPTKSTSYVRTLDSVLKKQVPATSPKATDKVKPAFLAKVENKIKNSLKAGKGKQTKVEPKPALCLKRPQQFKKHKNKTEFKSLKAENRAEGTVAVAASKRTSVVEVSASNPSAGTGGRSPGLPKTLVKLLDVEDGAVWEGRHRTYITKERAAIALATLVTLEGVTKGTPDANRIIRRRAPPCLNVFCRLGCLCASLVHSRRNHHCGKPQCMLGCSCLRRKVVALKTPKLEESTDYETEPQVMEVENNAKWKKKIKMRKTYVLTDPETAPEPAKRVNTLWDRTKGSCDSEVLLCPPPPRSPPPPIISRELQQDLESFLSPLKHKKVEERISSTSRDNIERNMTCARCRPFYSNGHDKEKTVDKHNVSPHDIEEGELVPLNMPGPAKRLEIISECSWTSVDMRNNVMQIVCEHMAQDRLKHPFWIGKYFVKPVSKTLEEKEKGSVDIYKVIISQPVAKKIESEKDTQIKEELKEPVEKSKVKGLPFFSKCCPAGLLKAEKKAPNASGQIMVNGKPYPQAKLELGQMGALHPANRLAAYITGRICPTVSTITKPSTTSTPVPASSVATVSTVSCTPALKTTSVVDKPPVGNVFTQFVVSHINSQNLSNTSTSHLQPLPPKIIIPSSMLMLGKEAGAPDVALSPLNAGVVTQVSESSDSTGSTAFPTVSKVQIPAITILTKSPSLPLGGTALNPTTPVSSSALTSPGKKTLVIKVASRNTGLPSSGAQIKKPLTQTGSSQTPGQKMLLQVVKTADGNTLYRNSNGQLMQLVPLSQIKAINPSLLQGQPTLIRLPAPPTIVNKPLGGSVAKVASSTPTTQTLPNPIIPVPVSSSPSVSGKPVPLTTSKTVSLSSLPSTLKVVQSFLGQSGTCTLRILPSTSSTVLPQSGLTLLQHSSSTAPKPDSSKSDTTVSVSSHSTEVPVGQVDKQSKTNPPMEINNDNSNVKQKSSDKAPDPKEIASDSSEITDDSDLYSDDDEDQETASCSSLSDKEEKVKDEDVLESEMKGYAEVVVDIETVEESTEKNNIAKLRASAYRRNQCHSPQKLNLELRIKRTRLERKRRHTLREGFMKLKEVLGMPLKDFPVVSRMRILTKTQKEIEYLVTQEDCLVEKKEKLRYKRDCYIQTLSQLCDKSTESITQKLNEIIAKQKTLEGQSKPKEINPKRNKAKPKAKPKTKQVHLKNKQKGEFQNKVKDPPKSTYSPSKPIDLSIKRQKSMEKDESVSKSVSMTVHLDESKITVDSKTGSTSTSTQPSFNSTPQKQPASVPSPSKHTAVSRERTRPNILSRASSQSTQGSAVKEPVVTKICMPQVLPLMNTMVPCNQIITINNPLQPIGITSVGANQSSTPGVASVSIVPTISHTLGVGNPLPMLHPQFIKITNSPVNINKKADSPNLSNITNVISLVPPAENLVITQKVVEEASAVQELPTSVDSPPDAKSLDLVKKTEDVPKQSVEEDENIETLTSTNQEVLEKKSPDDSDDPEDENLMSLLDELVLLSQQLTNEEEAVEGDEQSGSDKQADAEQSDERSLSPLFLTLDEDLMSPDSKEESDIPPQMDDLVKVIFGSDSPTVSSESGLAPSTNALSPPESACNATPPPLLHMKSACEAASGQSANEGASVTWRPMPKLVPLGLKTQDAIVNKVISSSAINLDSIEEDVNKPQL